MLPQKILSGVDADGLSDDVGEHHHVIHHRGRRRRRMRVLMIMMMVLLVLLLLTQEEGCGCCGRADSEMERMKVDCVARGCAQPRVGSEVVHSRAGQAAGCSHSRTVATTCRAAADAE